MPCCDDTEAEAEGKNSVRNMTDGPCLVVLVLVWCVLLVISVFSFTFGDPDRLSHGYDSFGNVCGSPNNRRIGRLKFSGLDMTSKPYLFHFGADPAKSVRICVGNCPDVKLESLEDLRRYMEERKESLCFYNLDATRRNSEDVEHGLNESLTLSSAFGPCPEFPIPATSVIMNRCIPTNISPANFLQHHDKTQLLLTDIHSNWHVILSFILSSFFGSFALFTLFYLTTTLTTYLVVISSVLVPIIGIVVLWLDYCHYSSSDHLDFGQGEAMLLASASIVTVVVVFILISILTMLYVLKEKMVRVNLLFKESGDCLRALPAIFAQPFITFLLLASFYTFWMFQMSYLMSARYPSSSKISGPFYGLPQGNQSKNLSEIVNYFTTVEFSQGAWVEHMWWICIVCLLWISEFLLACQQMTTSGAVARWYFDGKVLGGKNPVWVSIRYLLLYHMGSAAFGSLLISILRVPRFLTGLFYRRFREGVRKNSVTNCVFKTCLPLFDCFENFTAYVSHNAYAIVQMRGINFLSAGRRAWIIDSYDPLDIRKESIAANTIAFMSKVLVTSSVGTLAFLYFKSSQVNSPIGPTLLITIVTYFVAHCVFSVFELSIDTICMCLAEDHDINEDDGLWRLSPLVPHNLLPAQTKASTSHSPY